MLSDTFTSSIIVPSVQKALQLLEQESSAKPPLPSPSQAAPESLAVGQRQPEGDKSTVLPQVTLSHLNTGTCPRICFAWEEVISA